MTKSLNLNCLPPIYILPTHLPTDELHEAEDSIYHAGGTLSYSAKEAQIFLGRILQKKRAAFDLRARGVWTQEAELPSAEPPRKRRRTIHSPEAPSKDANGGSWTDFPDLKEHVLVLKMDWLDHCLKEGIIVPYKPYIVYTGRVVPRPENETQPKPLSNAITYIKAVPDTPSSASQSQPTHKTPTVLTSTSATASSTFSLRRRHADPSLTHQTRLPPKLTRTTTSEFEETSSTPTLPDPPDWVKAHSSYSCLRSTPMHPPFPNILFINLLIKIRDARLLTLDHIGVRAYSTSIASLCAYPYPITTPHEITRLPGCSEKIALLWSEWQHSSPDPPSRTIKAVDDLSSDVDLLTLRLFWNIWGVGPETARKFYFEYGWRDLDDIVEFGWNQLSRVQQIGVKFYDEFESKIPRKEVEEISDVILKHARMCKNIPESKWGTEEDMVLVIVGGYRRGKELCGDVDVILSHRDDKVTRDLVVDVVGSLETEGWVTHTLTLNTTTSDRAGQTLPYRSEGGGHGFDSLDKALCVWQNPVFDQTAGEQEEGKGGEGGEGGVKKNPNIHRRVDIIVSTWRTVGCAVLGWSGGTTFQRDIRRYVSKEHGWKFDSSGVRDRANGQVIDLESVREGHPTGQGDTWLDREKRLMDGLGIGWRDADERCTG